MQTVVVRCLGQHLQFWAIANEHQEQKQVELLQNFFKSYNLLHYT